MKKLMLVMVGMLFVLPLFAEPVIAVAVSGDSKMIATSGNSTNVWDLVTGKKLYTVKDYAGEALCFNKTGSRLAIGSEYSFLTVIDLLKNKSVFFVSDSNCTAAFSPDDKTIFGGFYSPYCKAFDVATGKEVGFYRVENHYVGQNPSPFKLSPDGKKLVMAYVTISVWDVASQKQERLIAKDLYEQGICTIDTDKRFTTVVSGSFDGLVEIRNLSDGTVLHSIKYGDASVYDVCYNADDSIVAFCMEKEKDVLLWNLSDDSITKLEGHTDAVRTLQYSSDGKYLVTGSLDGTAKVWSTSDYKCVLTIKHENVK